MSVKREFSICWFLPLFKWISCQDSFYFFFNKCTFRTPFSLCFLCLSCFRLHFLTRLNKTKNGQGGTVNWNSSGSVSRFNLLLVFFNIPTRIIMSIYRSYDSYAPTCFVWRWDKMGKHKYKKANTHSEQSPGTEHGFLSWATEVANQWCYHQSCHVVAACQHSWHVTETTYSQLYLNGHIYK